MSGKAQSINEEAACEVCRRTMLKGERTESYLTPARERKLVCALCAPRAQREGWIRESARPETPARPARQSDRRGLLRRIGRRRAERAPERAEGNAEEQAPGPDVNQGFPARAEAGRAGTEPTTPRDPREIRAVPTNSQLKLDRATEVFNESEHRRTIAGIGRTLGLPRVSVLASETSAAEVVLTVAWELAWYQYAVDLSDPREPVQLRARGEELDELPDECRDWNAQALKDGWMEMEKGDGAQGGADGRSGA